MRASPHVVLVSLLCCELAGATTPHWSWLTFWAPPANGYPDTMMVLAGLGDTCMTTCDAYMMQCVTNLIGIHAIHILIGPSADISDLLLLGLVVIFSAHAPRRHLCIAMTFL